MTNEKDVSLEKPLDVDDKCDVRWRDGNQSLPAKVIERRPLHCRKRKKKDPTVPPVEDLKPEEIEYYVHYVDHDRRLDEWVTLDKFLLETLERAEKVPEPTAEDARRLRRRSSANLETSAAANGDATAILSGGNWRGGSGDPSFAALEREHEETTKVKNIEKIYMGGWEVECWYFSPYPDEYADADTLYVCEFCLKYMRKKKTFRKHKAECEMRHPPGREIYRELGLSVYEVDGKEHRVYCQNLCLFAKLFLDHKTLYYDVDPFYFYIICEVDDAGAHIVGYFSKEKVRSFVPTT
jgi:histone acetyltransferase MYST1